MSVSRNKKRKAARAKRSGYAKEVARKIKAGIFPKFYFAKTGDRLERTPAPVFKYGKFGKPGLSMRLIGTLAGLTKDEVVAGPDFIPVNPDPVLDHMPVTQEAPDTKGEDTNG
jgi:hypothetical protein